MSTPVSYHTDVTHCTRWQASSLTYLILPHRLLLKLHHHTVGRVVAGLHVESDPKGPPQAQ